MNRLVRSALVVPIALAAAVAPAPASPPLLNRLVRHFDFEDAERRAVRLPDNVYRFGGDTGAVGTPCSRTDHRPCRSAWCMEDETGAPPYCTDTCSTDGDCPTGYQCRSKLFDTNGDGTDDISYPLCHRRGAG